MSHKAEPSEQEQSNGFAAQAEREGAAPPKAGQARVCTIRGRIVNLHHQVQLDTMVVSACADGIARERALAANGVVQAKTVSVKDMRFEFVTELEALSFTLTAMTRRRGISTLADAHWSRDESNGDRVVLDARGFDPEAGTDVRIEVAYSEAFYKRTRRRATELGLPETQECMWARAFQNRSEIRCTPQHAHVHAELVTKIQALGVAHGPLSLEVQNIPCGNIYHFDDVSPDAAGKIRVTVPDGATLQCRFAGLPADVLATRDVSLLVYDRDGRITASAWLRHSPAKDRDFVRIEGLPDGSYTCVAVSGRKWKSTPITTTLDSNVETQVTLNLARVSNVRVTVSEVAARFAARLYVDGSSAILANRLAAVPQTAWGQLLPPARWILDIEFENGKTQRRVLDVTESGKHYRF